MRRLLLLCGLMLAVAACGDKSSGPPVPTISGLWVEVEEDGTLTMQLTQTGQQVTGSGVVTNGVVSVAIVVSGTYVHPTASLAIGNENGVFNFVGTLSASQTRLTGTISGNGIPPEVVTFTRQ